MKIDIRTSLELSRLSSREVFGKALNEITEKDDNTMVIVADVMTSAKLCDFNKNFPEKLINVGIAEQNMLGIASGLASEGYNVFTTTFAPFASMRCFEQLRTQVGYMKLNVKTVGILSGLAGGVVGNTHYGLEDIAITRTIPNMTVISPADCIETYKAVEALKDFEGPCYLRLTGTNGTPCIYKEDFEFKIGKSVVMQEGTDIAIIATGTMVYEVMRASKALKKQGISAKIINMHTIKPLDTQILDEIFKNFKFIVTVEEHFKIGGLGSAVAEYKSGIKNAPQHLILGIENIFEKAGTYSFMLNKFGLTAPQIAQKIMEKYKGE